MQGLKHLVECNCVLPQFASRPSPPFHQFIVFSIVDEDDRVVPKYAQCNNCGVLHHVVDIHKSEVLAGKENANALVSVEDIKLSLSKEIVDVLTKYNVDLASWEQAQFIIDNERWGEHVVLASEVVNGQRVGKYLQILGRALLKVSTFTAGA